MCPDAICSAQRLFSTQMAATSARQAGLRVKRPASRNAPSTAIMVAATASSRSASGNENRK